MTEQVDAMNDGGASQAHETPLGNGGYDANGRSNTGEWSGNWRQSLAGEDRNALKTLDRFPDPNAFWKSYQSMRAKVSSGEVRALADNATPEQMAEWRLANGIPEAPDRYDIALDDGLQIGETDRPLVDNYLAVAHQLNHTPDQVNANLNWYFAQARQQEEAIADANLAARGECEAELRSEWGHEYKTHLNGIVTMLDGAPKGVKQSLLAAKSVDGTNLLNQPGVMRWLAQMSRELNPVATVVGVGGASLQGIDEEIAQIEGVMKSDRAKYNGDERMQERLRKLYGAREKLGR
jgi:hypothetical protein